MITEHDFDLQNIIIGVLDVVDSNIRWFTKGSPIVTNYELQLKAVRSAQNDIPYVKYEYYKSKNIV